MDLSQPQPEVAAAAAKPAIPPLESFAPARRRTGMAVGIGGALLSFGLAVAAAVAKMPDLLVYALAAGCFVALGLGMAASIAQDRSRERLAIAAYAGLPREQLSRATVSNDVDEKTRVLIVRVLNDHHPGWRIDLEQAHADWQDLRNATGAPGGCMKSCCGR